MSMYTLHCQYVNATLSICQSKNEKCEYEMQALIEPCIYFRTLVIVGTPNRKKMHIFGFVGIFEYIC